MQERELCLVYLSRWKSTVLSIQEFQYVRRWISSDCRIYQPVCPRTAGTQLHKTNHCRCTQYETIAITEVFEKFDFERFHDCRCNHISAYVKYKPAKLLLSQNLTKPRKYTDLFRYARPRRIFNHIQNRQSPYHISDECDDKKNLKFPPVGVSAQKPRCDKKSDQSRRLPWCSHSRKESTC